MNGLEDTKEKTMIRPDPPDIEDTLDTYECDDQTIYYTLDEEQIVVMDDE